MGANLMIYREELIVFSKRIHGYAVILKSGLVAA
jgi:hypothetical protein